MATAPTVRNVFERLGAGVKVAGTIRRGQVLVGRRFTQVTGGETPNATADGRNERQTLIRKRAVEPIRFPKVRRIHPADLLPTVVRRRDRGIRPEPPLFI